jgi:hypothetical protein
MHFTLLFRQCRECHSNPMVGRGSSSWRYTRLPNCNGGRFGGVALFSPLNAVCRTPAVLKRKFQRTVGASDLTALIIQ